MKTKSIAFIGGGRITRIFLRGFSNKAVEFKTVMVYDSNQDVLNKLKKDFPFIEIKASAKEASSGDLVFIALHPPAIAETLAGLKPVLNPKALLISLAPKFSIGKLEDLSGMKRIVRIIPNATSFINEGFNPVSFSETIGSAEKEGLMEFLSQLGKTFETEERKLEAYALASAMLPTYFWFQWKEMEKIAQEMGLTETEGREAIRETLTAALDLQYDSGLSFEELIDLIPVKPIGENEKEIISIYNTKLTGLFEKIKP